MRSIAIALVVLSAAVVNAATTKPVAPLSDAQLDRGATIRGILIDALEDAYAHEGEWPAKLSDTQLVYTRPKKRPPDATEKQRIWSRRIATATIVVYEPTEQHADGAWVGYADGHIEFARTAKELKSFQEQLSIIRDEDSAGTTQPAAAGTLALKIVDSEGKPVEGALIGIWGMFGDGPKIFGDYPTPPAFTFSSGKTIRSNKDGRATIAATDVFAAKFERQPTAPLYILQEKRQLAAEIDLARADFGEGAQREVHLLPACKVHGDVTCLGLRGTDRTIERTLALIAQPGRSRMYSVQSLVKGTHFEFVLPPGAYHLQVYGTATDYVYHHFRIAPGQREINFVFDIPPDTIASLYGKPAPELRQIKGWKNGGPTSLAQLRGKVVILDFWGYWCNPCCESMPALMKLHDQYKDKGLVVIGVHNDSIASIAEMDEKLTGTRARQWNGRDLPFLVALDGGGPTRIKYSATVENGATTAAYGITSYPTTVIIDREGKLVDSFDAGDPKSMELLERLLNAKAP